MPLCRCRHKGKKTTGRKRNIATDCLGLLLLLMMMVTVTAASVADRDGAHRLLALLRERFSTISLVWADGGSAGRLVLWATEVPRLAVTIITRTDNATGFVVLPPQRGRGAHRRLADPLSTLGQRLRTTTRTSRGHGLVDHRHPHDPPPRPRTRRHPNHAGANPDQTTKPHETVH